jgi:hypothetical protein
MLSLVFVGTILATKLSSLSLKRPNFLFFPTMNTPNHLRGRRHTHSPLPTLSGAFSATVFRQEKVGFYEKRLLAILTNPFEISAHESDFTT